MTVVKLKKIAETMKDERDKLCGTCKGVNTSHFHRVVILEMKVGHEK